MQFLATLLNSLAANVFVGTLPLLGAIVWSLLQNDRRFQSLEKRIDALDKGIDQRLGRLESRMDRMDSRLDAIDIKLSAVVERLVKVETKLEGGHLVLSRT